MRVHFDRWQETVATYESWWKGELGRPIVNLSLIDSPDVAEERLGRAPELPFETFTGSYPADVSPEAIVDRWDWELASRRYVADGFPSIWPNFGAGVVAAMTGCEMLVREDTIWFEPKSIVPSGDLSIGPDVTTAVALRIADIYRQAVALWGGVVQLGATDLGGTLDVLQSLFPSQRLALELYDRPDEMNRLIWEVHAAWWAHFDAFQAIVAETNPGYTAWTPLLSRESYYMLQCDFAYMIGPDMFDEFVLPELTASCARLGRPFYHLDGEGQLIHLDKILAIPGLAGVQWIPGDGAADVRHWPEIYGKIRDAGKLIQLFVGQSEAGLEILDLLADQLGDLSGVAIIGDVRAGLDEEAARKILERHAIPWLSQPEAG
ncbi:MAG: hypothetical protein KOO61_02080 [Spirochaetales bacterium]|nr:hypothetical protein [Spirochaetales bacterium]